MVKKLWAVIKWCLIVWGIVALIGVSVLGGTLLYKFGPGNKDSNKTASVNDVRFVLNWCNLGADRIDEVVHSYKSARSFTGDHLDAHAIRISHVNVSELTKNNFGSGWYRCDQTTGVLKDAVNWLNLDSVTWFPKKGEYQSSEMYVYPWSIYCHGIQPTAVKLIFICPKDKMVFFVSMKT